MTGKIIGLGSYLPEKVLTNDDLSLLVETSDEWIQERTGIKRRHISDHKTETTSYMAGIAAQRAVEDAGIEGSDIDLIVAASTTPDVVFPSIACMVQKAIGAGEDCGCFDVNSACPGWIAAFLTAQSFIQAGRAKKALVVGAETLSNYVDWTDRGTCILFGDGAGCAVLEASEGTPVSSIMRSSCERGDCLFCANMKQPDRLDDEEFIKTTSFQMAGRDVFRFAVTEVPKIIRDVLKKAQVPADEIDYFILHQANARIIEATAKKLKIGLEKFPMTLQETGNTSSASIPSLLSTMKKEGKLQRGQKLVIASFGGGLTWDAAYLEY
ncbi:MAG: ketoacyl-ACP synthase III [Clostridiales bacterium]|nr:ketoacyl-ACP synthase III [Clostridiales bacterium]